MSGNWPGFDLVSYQMGGIEQVSTPAQSALPQSSALPISSGTDSHNGSAPVINSSMRILALDGLRGIAILLVLIRHSVSRVNLANHPTLNWIIGTTSLAWSGVDLFFVLSGFLIGGILLDARNSPNYFKTFYIRRAYRILPIYSLVPLLCWLAYAGGRLGWISSTWVGSFAGALPWWAFLTFTQNICMAFAPKAVEGSFGITWSLAVEEQFYLTLPLLIRYTSPQRLLRALVPSIVIGAAVLRAVLIMTLPNGESSVYFLMPTRADALGMGVLAALLVRDARTWSWLREHRAWLYGAAGVFLFPLAVISLLHLSVVGLYGTEYSMLALFYASLLLIAVTGQDRFVKLVFCNRALMSLGLIAYGTYLMHRLLIQTVHLGLAPLFPSASAAYSFLTLFLGIGLTLLIAQISWTWFEKPLVRRGHHYHY